MPRFKDVPLGTDRFRLFRFKHDSEDMALEVKTFKIYRAPKYQAISYCWGDKFDGTVLVPCNGESLEVWANLFAALRRLHREASGSWYWCDAICIEQGQEEMAMTEKLQQISFMETIFTLAEPVIVWLGDASMAEEQAFQYLVSHCETAVRHGVARHETNLPSPKDEIWRHWAQTLLRPWFTRLWICQEALINDGKVVIMLGAKAQATWAAFCTTMDRTQCVPWSDELIEYEELDGRAQIAVDRDFHEDWGVTLGAYNKASMGRNGTVKLALLRNIVNIQELLFLEKYHDAKFGFLPQMLKVFGNRKCTYNQDRPNAMRGLLPNSLKKGLKTYSADADVATVYLEVTRLWLTNDPTLSLLQRIRPLSQFLPKDKTSLGTKLNNPSWVIDLGRVLTEALGAGIPNRKDGFHAGLTRSTRMDKYLSSKQVWMVPSSNSLAKFKSAKNVTFRNNDECHISGVRIGLVRDVVSSPHDFPNLDPITSNLPPEYYLELRQWVDQAFNMIKSEDADDEAAQEIHWRTLVINRTNTMDPEVTSMFDTDNKHSRLKAYLDFLKTLRSLHPELLQQADPLTADYYSTVFLNQRDFPNYFSTSGGYVGRSYGVPRPNDVVAVFYGASTPFLLRPVPGQETCQLIGEAYCHGVMQGEALLKENKAYFLQQVFKLI